MHRFLSLIIPGLVGLMISAVFDHRNSLADAPLNPQLAWDVLINPLPALVFVALVSTSWASKAEAFALKLIDKVLVGHDTLKIFTEVVAFANDIGQPEGVIILRRFAVVAARGNTLALEALEKSDPHLLRLALRDPSWMPWKRGPGWIMKHVVGPEGKEHAKKLIAFTLDLRTVYHLSTILTEEEEKLLANFLQRRNHRTI